MARLRSWNAYESELTSGIDASATSFDVLSAAVLSVNTWLVIDPDDALIREYVKVVGISGDTLTVEQRGGAGSADGAQPHAGAAKVRAVPVHQWLDEIWDDIEANTLDLGNHEAASDPHPGYITEIEGDGRYLLLAGGQMAGDIDMGTNKVTNMSDPTADKDAATKVYVDAVDAVADAALAAAQAAQSTADSAQSTADSAQSDIDGHDGQTTGHPPATTGANGLMSSADKAALDAAVDEETTQVSASSTGGDIIINLKRVGKVVVADVFMDAPTTFPSGQQAFSSLIPASYRPWTTVEGQAAIVNSVTTQERSCAMNFSSNGTVTKRAITGGTASGDEVRGLFTWVTA